LARTDLAHYPGEDGLNLPWLTIGGSGIVSVVSQVAGAIEKEMIDAVDRSDLPTASAAHRRLAPLAEAIRTRMPGAVSAKAALYLQGGRPHYAMRGPHVGARAPPLRGLAAADPAAGGLPTPCAGSRWAVSGTSAATWRSSRSRGDCWSSTAAYCSPRMRSPAST